MKRQTSKPEHDDTHAAKCDVLVDTGFEGFSFKQIEAFLQAVKLRSISKAARQLHMTQSGLSRLLSSLELSVGDRLFERSPNGLVLTQEGTTFFPHALRIQRCYQDALAAVLEHASSGYVLAGCDVVLPRVLPHFLPKLFAKFQLILNFKFSSMTSQQVLEEVSCERANLGICMRSSDFPDLKFQPLLSAEIGLLVGPGIVLPDCLSSIEIINKLPLVRLPDNMVLPQLLHRNEKHLRSYFNAPLTANNMTTLLAAIQYGDVATLVSSVAASTSMAKGLRFIPLPHIFSSMQLCIVKHVNSKSCPTNDLLESLLVECIHDLNWLPNVKRI